jgi:hypothetical protein
MRFQGHGHRSRRQEDDHDGYSNIKRSNLNGSNTVTHPLKSAILIFSLSFPERGPSLRVRVPEKVPENLKVPEKVPDAT